MFLIKAAFVIILVDFLSGLVHWAEDTFGTENTPIVGNWIIKPNVIHHNNGSTFVNNSWLKSSWDLLIVGILILLIAFLYGQLTWQIWLFVIIGVNANQIHKWNHIPKIKVPRIIRIMQKIRLLQTQHHHAIHHYGEKNTHYCVITEFVNPVLDSIRFWRIMERILVPIFGAPRREDLKNINNKIIRT